MLDKSTLEKSAFKSSSLKDKPRVKAIGKVKHTKVEFDKE